MAHLVVNLLLKLKYRLDPLSRKLKIYAQVCSVLLSCTSKKLIFLIESNANL